VNEATYRAHLTLMNILTCHCSQAGVKSIPTGETAAEYLLHPCSSIQLCLDTKELVVAANTGSVLEHD
jgi:hypothetical protein